MPPAEIWTWPFGMGSLMFGAEMTTSSRMIANCLLTFAVVCSANRRAPVDFRTKLTVRWPVSSVPIVELSISDPLNSDW